MELSPDLTRHLHRTLTPNIALAKDVLDWETTVQLREGLRRTIEYFDGLLSTQAH